MGIKINSTETAASWTAAIAKLTNTETDPSRIAIISGWKNAVAKIAHKAKG